MKKQYYEKEFKIEVCKKILREENTVGEIAKAHSISRPIVSRWVAEYQRYKNKAFSGKSNRLPDKAKIYALEKQIERLEMENEILKKFEALMKQEKRKIQIHENSQRQLHNIVYE